MLLQFVHEAVIAGRDTGLAFFFQMVAQLIQHPFADQPQAIAIKEPGSTGPIEGKQLFIQ